MFSNTTSARNGNGNREITYGQIIIRSKRSTGLAADYKIKVINSGTMTATQKISAASSPFLSETLALELIHEFKAIKRPVAADIDILRALINNPNRTERIELALADSKMPHTIRKELASAEGLYQSTQDMLRVALEEDIGMTLANNPSTSFDTKFDILQHGTPQQIGKLLNYNLRSDERKLLLDSSVVNSLDEFALEMLRNGKRRKSVYDYYD